MGPSEGNSKGYRWSCPACRTSRVVLSAMGPRRAIEGLRAHLEIYDGAGHGPRNEFPSDVDLDRLDEFVVPLDGEERATDEGADRPRSDDTTRLE